MESDSGNENENAVVCLQRRNSSSDSDSDELHVKRPRATRTARQRSRVLVEKTVIEEQAQPGIYASRVNRGLANLTAGFLKTMAKTADSDQEEEPERKSEEKKKEPVSSGILISSGSEDENSHCSEDLIILDREKCENSPTPPPSPHTEFFPRRRRRNRKLQKTIKNLDKALSGIKPGLPAEVIITEASPVTERDRQLTVKVRSRSGIQRFNMKPMENFQQVIREMAAHEGVSVERIMMSFKDVTLTYSDTPKTLGLTVADIIECHIVSRSAALNNSLCDDDPDLLNLFVQAKNQKSRVAIKLRKTDCMERLMQQYAQKKGLSVEKLEFYFDGEKLSNSQTPLDLDMDEGDCIDVHI